MALASSNLDISISDSEQQLRLAESGYRQLRAIHNTQTNFEPLSTEVAKNLREDALLSPKITIIGSRLTGLDGELGSEFFVQDVADDISRSLGDGELALAGTNIGMNVYNAVTESRPIVKSAQEVAGNLLGSQDGGLNVSQFNAEEFGSDTPGFRNPIQGDVFASAVPNVSPTIAIDKSGNPTIGSLTSFTNSGSSTVSKNSTSITSNKLLDYSSFTYRITMQILTVQEYNRLILTQTTPLEQNIIAATGGIDKRKKDPAFISDFFLDDVKMSTVVGMNSIARGSNVTNISFSIIEPNGVSFMERIVTASAVADIPGSLIEQPYLFTIKFYGYDENGMNVEIRDIPPKYIPFRITSIDFDINTSGSRYNFTAMPYHDVASQHIIGTLPYEMEIESDGVHSIFNEGSRITVIKQINVSEADLLDSQAVLGQSLSSGSNNVRSVKTKGLISILNDYQNTIVASNKQKYPDIYEISFDPGFTIDELKFVYPSNTKTAEAQNTSMHDQLDSQAVLQSNRGNTKINTNVSKHRLPIGTQITEVINRMMKLTKYVRSQFEANGHLKQHTKSIDSPLKWWKVVPEIELLQWDPQRNEYQKKIKYVIKPYQVIGLYNDNVPLNNILAVKEYNYIFTGKNEDVFNFDIHLNAMYYEARTLATVNQEGRKIRESKEDDGGTVTKTNTSRGTPMGQPVKRVVGKTQELGSSNADKITIAINDVATHIYSQAKADFLSADITILGDPDFIKQDQIFFGAKSWQKPTLPDGHGISFDNRDVYVRFNILTPENDAINEDIDEFTVTKRRSIFSGMYKPLTVENNFAQGKFTQNLYCVKAVGGPDDAPVPNTKTEPSYGEAFFDAGGT